MREDISYDSKVKGLYLEKREVADYIYVHVSHDSSLSDLISAIDASSSPASGRRAGGKLEVYEIAG